MEYTHLIQERFSIRKFTSQAVTDSQLKTILEAAKAAPTAVNNQPQRLLVLRRPEDLAKLKDCTPYTFNAPLAIIVAFNKNEAWVRKFDNYNSGTIDASIVGTHIMLAVHNMGLGCTWVGYFDPAKLRQSFTLPAHIEPIAIFPIGYPAPDAAPSAKHAERRPLHETVLYDSF